MSITTGSRVCDEHDLFIPYQREDVGVAVLKACPVSHPIRCCSHNRPPLGSSALGMSKSYIGIKHRAGLTNHFPLQVCHDTAKTSRFITSQEVQIIDTWMVGQRNGRIQKEVQNASIKAKASCNVVNPSGIKTLLKSRSGDSKCDHCQRHRNVSISIHTQGKISLFPYQSFR